MIKILTPEQISTIEKEQAILQESWKNRQTDGEIVEYLGKNFVVFPDVFPPGNDSKILVQNLPELDNSTVLDIATGCGVIAIFASLRGARQVTAVDINPNAVKCAQHNVINHGISDHVDVQLSDLFEQLLPSMRFDVITANLPFRKKYAPDIVASAQWDTDFELHRRFFSQVSNFLNPQGRLYMPQPNYPELNETLNLAQSAGFKTKEIGSRLSDGIDPRDYYVFEMSVGQSGSRGSFSPSPRTTPDKSGFSTGKRVRTGRFT
ncbi:MAG: methyltransferase [Deltaproteobacteria bacterium]|nr:methyltransferase [Deltaproteobacteria bacterium]